MSGREITGGVRTPTRHDSGHKHVSGTAVYVDDIPTPADCLQVFIATSRHAHAEVTAMDLSAVRAAPGVVDVISRDEIPGINDVSPAMGDDPMFAAGAAGGLIAYHGQSLFAVAAPTIAEARAAADLAELTLNERPAIITIDQAMEAGSLPGAAAL